MPGRPLHDYWGHANFVALKRGSRNRALCLLCNKELKNTAKVRLMGHRNICNGLPQDVVVKGEVDIIETTEDFESEGYEPQETNETNNEDPFQSIEVYVDKTSHEIFIPQNTSSTPVRSESKTVQQEKRNYLKQIKLDGQEASTSDTSRSSPKKIKLETVTHASSAITNEDINLAFAEFFFSSNIPFTVLDSVYLKQFVEKLNKSYKLPNLKELSTVCLDKVCENCTTVRPTDQQPAILVLSGWKNFTESSKIVVACVQLRNESREFLNTWDFDIFSNPDEGLSKVLEESETLAKSLFNAKLYAVISDNVDLKFDSDSSNNTTLWHTICHSHLAGLLADDIIDSEISRNVSHVLKAFQRGECEEKILEAGGTRIVLPWENRWCTYRDAFLCFLKNNEIMRKLIVKGNHTIHSDMRQILFDDDLSDKLLEYLEVLEPLCKLIYISQKKKSSVSAVVEEWLKLDFPEEFQPQLDHRRSIALSPFALAANFIDPKFRGQSLSEEQMEIVEYFFLEVLDSKALDDLFVFKANGGIFKALTTKGITTYSTFWSIAERKHPELAMSALNLLRIPASASYVDKLFSSWSRTHLSTRNMLGMDVYKKLMKTYFTLRLSNNANYNLS